MARLRGLVESLERRPPVKVTAPFPKAASLPIRTAPVLSVTPPIKSFVPLRVRFEDPFFTKRPFEPEIIPENIESVDPLMLSALV